MKDAIHGGLILGLAVIVVILLKERKERSVESGS